ncbi:MAG: CopG family transcriptional regulator [Pseudonocardiaceae bacterium]
MTDPRILGHTESGQPITDTDVEAMAAEAEVGYDVNDLIARRGRRGRPPLGAGPATVESVRLDPELRDELAARAAAEGVSPSELIRKALRRYLRAG